MDTQMIEQVMPLAEDFIAQPAGEHRLSSPSRLVHELQLDKVCAIWDVDSTLEVSEIDFNPMPDLEVGFHRLVISEPYSLNCEGFMYFLRFTGLISLNSFNM